jgi:dimethylpropiothetin dethiomethylase
MQETVSDNTNSCQTEAVQVLLKQLGVLLAGHDSDCAHRLELAIKNQCNVKSPRSESPRHNSLRVEPSSYGGTIFPACHHIVEAIAYLPPSFQETVTEANKYLSWRVPGFGQLPPDLADHLAVTEILGPQGLFQSDSVSLGIILLAPGVMYPTHKHAAEELYLVLSGHLHWYLDEQSVGTRHSGEFVCHKPWQRHAMTNGPKASLLFWGWTGDINGNTYKMGK